MGDGVVVVHRRFDCGKVGHVAFHARMLLLNYSLFNLCLICSTVGRNTTKEAVINSHACKFLLPVELFTG